MKGSKFIESHLTVRGVMTSLGDAPKYSYPYTYSELDILTTQLSISRSQQYLSCFCHSKFVTASTLDFTIPVIMSLPWTSIVIRAQRFARASLGISPRTMLANSFKSCTKENIYFNCNYKIVSNLFFKSYPVKYYLLQSL